MKLSEAARTIEKTSGIYAILRDDKMKGYIGQAIDLRVRAQRHLIMLNNNSPRTNKTLKASWNKHGEDKHTFVVLEFCSLENLTLSEQWWFDTFRSLEWTLMNIAPVANSQLGFRHSLESRRKISDVQKGRIASAETREKRSRSLQGNKNGLGYKFTMEQRQKLSLSRIGIPLTPKARLHYVESRRQRMKTYHIIDPLGVSHVVKGLHKFCKSHGLLLSGIMNTLKGTATHHQGWYAINPDEETVTV